MLNVYLKKIGGGREDNKVLHRDACEGVRELDVILRIELW